MRWLAYRVARALGWRFQGSLPSEPKMVIIGAPHTSNWDFFLFLATLHHLAVDVRFLAKHTLFRWPLRSLLLRLGGIPVDRRGAGGIVGQVGEAFASSERMVLVIAPEGTRAAADRWKSGFVEIAEKARVPLVLAGVDGENRRIVIGPSIEPGESKEDLMGRVRTFYSSMSGLRRAGKGPVRLDRGEATGQS